MKLLCLSLGAPALLEKEPAALQNSSAFVESAEALLPKPDVFELQGLPLTPLAQAIANQDWPAIKRLLNGEVGAEEKGVAAFRHALKALIEYRLPVELEVSRSLVNLLPPGSVVDMTDEEGQELLTEAVKRNKLDVIRLLLEVEVKFDVDRVYPSGDTLLIKAIKTIGPGQAKLVELLLQAGANTAIADLHGWPPLHRAIVMDQLDIVKLLLNYEASVKLKNCNGQTALEVAETSQNRNSADIMECLKQAKKDQAKKLLAAKLGAKKRKKSIIKKLFK